MSKAETFLTTLRGFLSQLRRFKSGAALIVRLGQSLMSVGQHGEKLMADLDRIWSDEISMDGPTTDNAPKD